MDWFLYDIGLRHERVKEEDENKNNSYVRITIFKTLYKNKCLKQSF